MEINNHTKTTKMYVISLNGKHLEKQEMEGYIDDHWKLTQKGTQHSDKCVTRQVECPFTSMEQ